MLLTLTAATAPARDLGYILHKHPDRLQSFDLPFGKAHVFYPQADEERCTAALLLDIDPVGLVRGRATAAEAGGPLDAYVNDRPYAASSFLSVAIARVLGAALSGRSTNTELAARELCLTATIGPLRGGGAADLPCRLFSPLGYEVAVTPVDENAGSVSSAYVSLSISATTTVQKLLTHIYVLVPVLDGEKHYWVGDAEVEKLFRFGDDWLPGHPERDLIAKRYLKRAPELARAALARLVELDDAVAGAPSDGRVEREEALERPLRLQERRRTAVAEVLRAAGVQSVADVGCGEGELIAELARDDRLQRIIGVDLSTRELERAKARLDRSPMKIGLRERIVFFQSSILYWDERLRGLDAIALLEVIEHVDAGRLGSLERIVFGEIKPKLAIVTTPNREYNALFSRLPAETMRHPDHRFEWNRAQFSAWAQGLAVGYGYRVRFSPIGDLDPGLGAPTQMAVFECA